jgi:hypothetical protein
MTAAQWGIGCIEQTIALARRLRQHEATSGRQTLVARAYPMAASPAR